MDELISIIVPIYNSEKVLDKCIKSIINQSYKNIEIILVNDGSIDNSLKICHKYAKQDSRVKIIDKKNEGVSVARNTGIKMASGIYITFVDADDWIQSDWIYLLYNELKNYNVDVIRGNYYKENDNGIYGKGDSFFAGKLLNNCNITQKEEAVNLILSGKLLSYVWLLLIRKSVLEQNKLLFNTEISMMEDTLLYVELFCTNASIVFTDILGYHYYDNKRSLTKSINNIEKNIENVLKLDIFMKNTIEKKFENNENYFQIINETHCNMILNMLFNLYKNNIFIKKDFKIFLNKIINDMRFIDIVKNAKIVKPIHFKIQYILAKRGLINVLIFYFYVRKILVKIKKMK